MFFSRRVKNLPLFNASDVPSKWKRVKLTTDGDNSDIDGDLESDVNNEPPPLVLVPSCPVKVGGKPLSKAEKYSKFLGLCASAGNLASLCGGNQFLQRCHIIESILQYWENNIEVVVTPISTEASSLAKETGKFSPCSETNLRPSVIVSHNSSVTIEGTNTKPIQGKPSEAISLKEHSGESGPPCRCGIPSKRYIPKFGPNMGKICYECSRKLPQISCGFFTVMLTEGSENHDSELLVVKDVAASNEENHYESKQSGGITSIRIKSSSDLSKISNLKLPVPKSVVGQPKIGTQRVFKKSTKPWSIPKHASTFIKSEKRAQKAFSIPDEDVTQISASEWRVKSQMSSASFKVQKMQLACDSCLCFNKVACIHCFQCECTDFAERKAPCKHIHKVCQLNDCSDQSDDSAEHVTDDVPAVDNTTKPWTVPGNTSLIADRNSHRSNAQKIPDENVTKISNLKWTVVSQSNAAKSYTVEKYKTSSSTCNCPHDLHCVHCFSCNCESSSNGNVLCKHIFKVQQIYASLLDEDTTDSEFSGRGSPVENEISSKYVATPSGCDLLLEEVLDHQITKAVTDNNKSAGWESGSEDDAIFKDIDVQELVSSDNSTPKKTQVPHHTDLALVSDFTNDALTTPQKQYVCFTCKTPTTLGWSKKAGGYQYHFCQKCDKFLFKAPKSPNASGSPILGTGLNRNTRKRVVRTGGSQSKFQKKISEFLSDFSTKNDSPKPADNQSKSVVIDLTDDDDFEPSAPQIKDEVESGDEGIFLWWM